MSQHEIHGNSQLATPNLQGVLKTVAEYDGELEVWELGIDTPE